MHINKTVFDFTKMCDANLTLNTIICYCKRGIQRQDEVRGKTVGVGTNWWASTSPGTFRSWFTSVADVSSCANLTNSTWKAAFTLERHKMSLRET